MDKELLDYIWENLEELKDLFPSKVYKILSKFKRDKDREGFKDTLEYILSINRSLLLKIEEYFKTTRIDSMSIDEVIKALKITPFDNFINKRKYIDRAEYWIRNYKNKKDIKYLNLLNNLAELYRSMGEYQKAEPLYLKVVKIFEKVLGEEHPNTATIYNNLAGLYESMGEYQKVELLYLKALNIGEKILGKEHPHTATSYNNLAGLYESMGENKKAEPLYIKALKTSEKILGEKHPNTLNIFNNFDNFRETQNKLFFLNSKNSNLEFRVDRVEVKNFKGYKSPFSLDFSENINIIIGENATGKTTLLQALVFGLAKKNFIDIRGLDYSRYITKGESEAEVRIIYIEIEKK